MKLYEIQRIGIERMLTELQSAAIDQELAKTAQGIGNATAARTGDSTNAGMPEMGDDPMAPGTDPMDGTQPGADPMGAPMGGDMGMGMGGGMPAAAGPMGMEPDPSMQAGDGLDGAEEIETKKIDSVILSAVSGMDFVDEYDHDNSKVSPDKILHMDMDELSQLRGAVLNTIKMDQMQDKFGLYASPDMKWYQDLRDFVDKVMTLKKQSERPVQKKRQGKTAKWEEKPKSKNSKAKQFRKPPKAKGAK